MKKHYSTEAGELLQLFMDLAAQIKQANRFIDGCLVIEGEIDSTKIEMYWKHQDGSISKLL